MINELISYYKKDLSPYKLVFIYMKAMWFSYIGLMVLSGISAFILLIASKHVYLILIIFILILILTEMFNRYACKIISRVHGISEDSLLKGLSKIRTQRLIMYLERNNANSFEKRKILTDLLYRKANSKRFKGFVLPGIFTLLALPIWVQFISWLFDNANAFEEAITIAISLTLSLSLFVVIFKSIRDTAYEEIFNREAALIQDLASLIEQITIFDTMN